MLTQVSPRLSGKRLRFLRNSTLESFHSQLHYSNGVVLMLPALERFIEAATVVNATATVVTAIHLFIIVGIESQPSVTRNSVGMGVIVMLPHKTTTLLHLISNV